MVATGVVYIAGRRGAAEADVGDGRLVRLRCGDGRPKKGSAGRDATRSTA